VITKDGFSKKEFTTGSVTIGRNVWIAANVTILKGSVIGDNCIIGAGTVVKGNIPENHLVYNERVLHSRPLR
jgi:acetyltransferase-like isoleucine patch superfamily enzyme